VELDELELVESLLSLVLPVELVPVPVEPDVLVEVEPVDVEFVDVESVDVEFVEVDPVDVESVDVAPVDVEFVDVESVDVGSMVAAAVGVAVAVGAVDVSVVDDVVTVLCGTSVTAMAPPRWSSTSLTSSVPCQSSPPTSPQSAVIADASPSTAGSRSRRVCASNRCAARRTCLDPQYCQWHGRALCR
jgi:hypothetical protein